MTGDVALEVTASRGGPLHGQSSVETAPFSGVLPAQGGRYEPDPVPVIGDQEEAAPTAGDQSAEIADAVISLIRTYGYLKSKLATVVDPEIASVFLLVRLVKDGPKRAKELADAMCAD